MIFFLIFIKITLSTQNTGYLSDVAWKIKAQTEASPGLHPQNPDTKMQLQSLISLKIP